jgi:hypothetical protein
MSSIMQVATMPYSKATFTFVSTHCEKFISTEFAFSYARLTPTDLPPEISLEYGKLMVESLINSGESSKSESKGSARNFSLGLQSRSSHTMYLARFSMLPQAKPIPNIKLDASSTGTDERARLLTLHYACIALAKEKFGVDPFKNHNKDPHYNKARGGIRKSFAAFMDQSSTSSLHSQQSASIAESFSLRENDGVQFHMDKMNCSSDDVTMSLSMLVPSHSIHDISKFHPSVSNGNVSINFLGYTRDIVHSFAVAESRRAKYLEDPSSCSLVKVCLNLLSLVKCPADYQGFLWENAEKSFHDRATHLSQSSHLSFKASHAIRHENWFGKSELILGTPAAFDIMGYYSIFSHIHLSLHFHEFLLTKKDAIDLCVYFGLICAGTSCLARTWGKILSRVDHFHAMYLNHGLFNVLCAAEPEATNLGNAVLPRIISDGFSASEMLKVYKDTSSAILRLSTACDFTGKKAASNSFTTIMTTIKSLHPKISSTKFQCFFVALCLSSILPLSMLKHGTIEGNSRVDSLLHIFFNSKKQKQSRPQSFENLQKQLFQLGHTKLTRTFLENMLSQMVTIAGGRANLNKGYLTSEAFMDSVKEDMSIADAPDLYFFDCPSSVINDPGHSSRLCIEIKFLEDQSMTVIATSGLKNSTDLKDLFVKSI